LASTRTQAKPKNADSAPGLWGMAGDRSKRIVALLIAGAAFLGTVAAALRVDSSARGQSAGRDGRAFIIKAVGKGNAGTQRYTLERSLLAEFQSLVTQGSVDLRLAQEALSRGEAAAHLREAARLEQVRENLRSFSSLLNPPYYDAESGAIDVLRFGADYMVGPPVKWTEMQSAKSEEASAWGKKSDRYLFVITILAVSLFLFGLALTLGGRLRLLFAAVGCLIVAAASAGMLAAALSAVPRTSEEAIKKYVDGSMKLYYAGLLALSGGGTPEVEAEVVRRADLALAGFSQALLLKHDYAAARRGLGETHLLIGQTLLFSRRVDPDLDQAMEELGQAVDSLKRVVRQGRADQGVYRLLGWAHLLVGECGQAHAATLKAFELAPENKLDLGIQIALEYVLDGQAEKGFNRLEDALLWAEANPLASDALTFRGMIQNFDRIMAVRTAIGLDRLLKRLKEAFVSISYRRTAAVKPTPASLGPLRFALPGVDERGRLMERTLADVFPKGTGRVDFLFDYAQLPRGSQVVQKVTWQGREAAWLTRVMEWSGAESGRAAWSLSAPVAGTLTGLNPGRYSVELYVDANLLQTGSFEIR
jgi:tetratricopeptide (TPR) repeat protein